MEANVPVTASQIPIANAPSDNPVITMPNPVPR